MVAAGTDGQGDDETEPQDLDTPLDPVKPASGGWLGVDGLAELLQGAGRTGPATPRPAHKKGRQEHEPKDDETRDYTTGLAALETAFALDRLGKRSPTRHII